MMHLSRSAIKLTLFGPLQADVGLKRDVRAGKAKEIDKGANMLRRSFILGSLAFGLAACGGAQLATIGPDGLPLAQVYRIGPQDADDIQFRMLDGLNALRGAAGAPTVQLNAQLNAAAATHSRDMSVQNRPWHFGSDGSSPIDRLRRVGYNGSLTGETISETYETEIETLGAWMREPNTRAVLLDNNATEMGIAWFQEGNGKIWWTLVLANANRRGTIAQENPVPLQ
ncbi:hypothetical protein OAN307_c46850 [Octadecabacter antarcticus 307]|uniref:SCP domain-containing protein n=2 Tax=Octadecabacter TaxID=53945 RepID=M9RBS4_9RHOB|nr:hypothetical protein OAN307_c46850 [Octadecabacter antarcticus 307]